MRLRRRAGVDLDEVAPFAPWSEFLHEFNAMWRANVKGKAEHVTLIGPNGQGKSMLALELLKERVVTRHAHVAILATKPRDQTLARLRWPVIRRWPPGYGQDQVIFWPKAPKGSSAATTHEVQRRAFEPMLQEVFDEGNRTVYFDEAAYFTDELAMNDDMKRLWQMGRSNNVIVVAGTQRPRGVPRPMFSECSWFFAFRTADEDELRRVGEIGGADSTAIREIMRSLAPHEFLCVQTRTGVMVRSKVTR